MSAKTVADIAAELDRQRMKNSDDLHNSPATQAKRRAAIEAEITAGIRDENGDFTAPNEDEDQDQ